MGRRSRGKIAFLFGLCVLVIGGGVASYWWVFLRLTPEDVLQRMKAAYSKANTFEEKVDFTVVSKMGDREMSLRGSTHLIIQKPNKLRRVTVMEMPLFGESKEVTVCDGKNLYREVSLLKQVLKAKAPKDIREVLGRREGGPISAEALLAGRDPAAFVESAKLEPGEKIGGMRTVLLSLRLKGGGQQQIWVDRKRFLIRKSKASLTQSSMGFTISTTLVEEVKSLKVNHTISQKQFTYAPPKGFKVVGQFKFPSAPTEPRKTE